jgi:hypothetical protein
MSKKQKIIRQCKYCNRIIPDNQQLADDICGSCYARLKDIRWFRKKTEPLREWLHDTIVQGVEFALDNGLKVRPEDLEKYERIIRERKENEYYRKYR